MAMNTEAKKTAKKTTAKTPARKTAPKAPKAPAITLDTLTTKLWEKLDKIDTSKIDETIAVQVNVADMGTFYVAINADETYKKQIIQAPYYMNDATVEATAADILKIAEGGFDYIAAIKAGTFNFYGNLAKGLVLKEIF